MKDKLSRKRGSVCPVADAVASQVLKRAERGMKKYGVNAARKDLSLAEWLQHLQEELLDAAVYVERLKMEIALNAPTQAKPGSGQAPDSAACLLDTWTDQRPSAPGHYWICSDHKTIALLQVEMLDGELQVYHGSKWRPVSDDNYWRGAKWSSSSAVYPTSDRSSRTDA